MARQLRIQYPGALYHVTSRGNEKKDIFQHDSDREKFLAYLKEAKERYKLLLYAYALMDNHYHLLIETPLANIAQIMHYINTSYTVYFNRKNSRYGHLFQGRYKAILVDKDDYLLELSRYIHLNPVRANSVLRPEEYRWSSHRDYTQSIDDESSLVHVEPILEYFSSQVRVAKHEYGKFVEEGLTDRIRSPFDHLISDSILGDHDFLDRIKEMTKNREAGEELSELRKIKKNITVPEVIETTSTFYKRKPYDITKRSRNNHERKMAIYLSKKLTLATNSEIGTYFNIKGSGVSHQVRQVSDTVSKSRRLRNTIERIVNSYFKV